MRVHSEYRKQSSRENRHLRCSELPVPWTVGLNGPREDTQRSQRLQPSNAAPHPQQRPPLPIHMEQLTRCWTHRLAKASASLNKHVHLKRRPLSQALGMLLPTHSLHRPSAEPILPQNKNSTRKEHKRST